MEDFKLYIDGEFVSGAGNFYSINPATSKPWAKISEARDDEVNRSVEAAHKALHSPQWSNLNASQRGKLLMKLADLIVNEAPRLAEVETHDTGKIIRETTAQIAYVADYYRYYAGIADKIEGAHLPIDKLDMEVWTRREPVGVVAAIIPWNSQLFLTAVKVGPALAAGCTIVVKASEDGAAPLLEFAKLIDKAGFPKGVINIITGFADSCGAVLTAHPKISHIAFTGGPETARHVVRASADNFASTSLELGGKSPFIVFDDANIVSASHAQVSGIFAAAGQSCVAGSRLLVQEGVKDEMVSLLKEKAENINMSSPIEMTTEVGPLCTTRQRDRIVKLVEKSIELGGKLITGGEIPNGNGFYYPPTIIDCSDAPHAPCVNEELFGPVLSVQSFSTEEEALQMANSTPYGLAAGVFTTNLTRAHRMVRGIRSGIVWINTYRAISPIAPFGGDGFSGRGREGGFAAVLDYTKVKTVWLRTEDSPIDDPFKMR